MDSGGPKEPCIIGGPDPPRGKGNFGGVPCDAAFRENSVTTYARLLNAATGVTYSYDDCCRCCEVVHGLFILQIEVRAVLTLTQHRKRFYSAHKSFFKQVKTY